MKTISILTRNYLGKAFAQFVGQLLLGEFRIAGLAGPNAGQQLGNRNEIIIVYKMLV